MAIQPLWARRELQWDSCIVEGNELDDVLNSNTACLRESIRKVLALPAFLLCKKLSKTTGRRRKKVMRRGTEIKVKKTSERRKDLVRLLTLFREHSNR